MQIKKAAEAVNSGAPTAVQLEAINAQAKAQLTAEQVYVFSLRLCDDQMDRDYERFQSKAIFVLFAKADRDNRFKAFACL